MDKTDEQVVSEIADRYLDESIERFIEQSFIGLLLHHDKSPENTQARAAITGNAFELCICEIFDRKYPSIHYKQNVSLKSAGMTGSGGIDFAIYRTNEENEILAVIEAKGSAERIEWPDGTVQNPNRPGLQRSDTVKKAVCQAYQIDQGMTKQIPFYIFTTHTPNTHSTKHLLSLAKGDIISDVIEVTNNGEISEFIQKIR